MMSLLYLFYVMTSDYLFVILFSFTLFQIHVTFIYKYRLFCKLWVNLFVFTTWFTDFTGDYVWIHWFGFRNNIVQLRSNQITIWNTLWSPYWIHYSSTSPKYQRIVIAMVKATVVVVATTITITTITTVAALLHPLSERLRLACLLNNQVNGTAQRKRQYEMRCNFCKNLQN